jgi:predicted XRE-type DNA-binding protein
MKKPVKRSKRPMRVFRGSGNVFADLGFSQREASELQMKAELTRQIYNRIKSLGLTQVRAAERLSISQPDVSKLMNGRHSGYSIERLISLLNGLSMDIDIVVRPNGRLKGDRRGIVRIMEVARAG